MREGVLYFSLVFEYACPLSGLPRNGRTIWRPAFLRFLPPRARRVFWRPSAPGFRLGSANTEVAVWFERLIIPAILQVAARVCICLAVLLYMYGFGFPRTLAVFVCSFFVISFLSRNEQPLQQP